jgi:hypothetical protein
MDTERATDLIHEIGTFIVNADPYIYEDWTEIAITVAIAPGVRSLTGFWWDASGKAHPAYPASDGFMDLCEALREATANPNGQVWKAMLIQIRRADAAVRFTYDWDDAERWKIGPANLETMRESLRLVD